MSTTRVSGSTRFHDMRVIAGLVLLLVLVHPAKADTGLTQLINAAYLPRTEDAELHEIAHQRAMEIASDFSHEGMRSGTAEVLALNEGYADPIAHVLSQWQGSPDHDAILSDPSYTRIGCAEFIDGTVHYFACVLAANASQPTSAPPNVTNPPESSTSPVLPNTAAGTP